MKKLLTTLVAIPVAAFTQVPQQDVTKDKADDAPVPKSGYEHLVNVQNSGPETRNDNTYGTLGRLQEDDLEVIKIGQTTYDLQSNSSVGRRIKVYDDGRVSAVWTKGDNDPSFPQRGTGYNHFNGNEWIRSQGDISRIENTRSGWPNIGSFGSGNSASEFTLTHIAGDPDQGSGGYVFSQNNEIGSTDFSSEVREPDSGPIWYRTATIGDTLFAIANYNLPNLDDDTELTYDLAQSRSDIVLEGDVIIPTVFYRSVDRGQSFVDSNILLPGYADSSERFRGTADDYSIDARDSIVAIVIAQADRSLTLWKSTDAGETWNDTVIRELGISTDQYINGEWGATDTVDLVNPNTGDTFENADVRPIDTFNDGSVSTVIDEEGTVHVTWANRVTAQFFGVESDATNNDPSELTQPFLLGPNVIQYWNDDGGEITNAGRAPTLGGPGDTSYTTPDGNVAYQVSASTRPMLSHLSNDTLFIAYEGAVAETDPNLTNGNNDYRDIYLIYSTDGGASWSEPLNVTQNAEDNKESAYVSVTKRLVDSQLHMIWQEDALPGSSAGQVGIQTSVTENSIQYTNISLENILADTIIRKPPSSVERKESRNASLALYPNPVQNNQAVTARINLEQSAEVQYKLVNAMGQVQHRKALGMVPAGKQQWTVPANDLAKGVYFLQVNVGEQTITKKLIQQ